MFSSVVFGGSRALPSSASGLVSRVVSRALASGAALFVGCALGADARVVSSALAAGGASRLSVFAVGSAAGVGFPRPGLPPAVASAVAAGASVSWLAGGSLSVPLVPRLAVRSRASVLAAGSGGCAVFFVASACSRGSWGCAAFAASRGLPVFVFPVGFSPAALAPLPGLAGSWVPVARSGLWASAVAWSPAQLTLF